MVKFWSAFLSYIFFLYQVYYPQTRQYNQKIEKKRIYNDTSDTGFKLWEVKIIGKDQPIAP